MAQKPRKSTSKKSLDGEFENALRKLEGARARRIGTILIRLVGEAGGDLYVHSGAAGCTVSREPGSAPPLIEVFGDAEQIRAVLDGSREGLAQFYRGGIRVRGDLHYLSELAHDMGLIREPFYVGE